MIRNTIIYTVGNMLPKAIVFIMLPIYMRYLSPEEYGLIQTINALVSVLSILYLNSLRTSVTRSYIDYDKHEEKQGFVLSLFIFMFVFSIFLSYLLLSSENIIAPLIFNNIPKVPYFKYLIILSLLSIFPILPLTMFRIREKAILFVSLNLLETVLIVLFTIYLLIIKDLGAIGSLRALIYARTVMAIIYTVYIIYFTKLDFKKFKNYYITSSLLLAIPLIPHFLAGWFNNAGDRVLIEHFLSLYELGIYSVGAQFNSGLMLLVTSFNLAFAPRFYKIMKQQKMKQTLFTNIFNFAVSSMVLVSFLVIIMLPFFIRHFGVESYQSNYIFIWLLIGGTLWHLGYIMSVSSLIYFKKMNKVAIITVITALVNILLNLVLIPIMGILGASLATYIAYFCEFYFVKRLANNFIKEIFKIEASLLYRLQILLLINLLAFYLLNNYLIVVASCMYIVWFIIKSYKNGNFKQMLSF